MNDQASPMRVGSLFSGIGGFDLGFERAGFEIAWMCEKDAFCREVLRKHWPRVPIYDDVQTLYTDDGPHPERPDVLIGGSPCQDISLAGKGEGLDGARSGLWWAYHRIISVVRPRYAVVENVPALVDRGLPAICGALSEIGYDAEWEIVSAAALGAPHLRERLFVVAYPHRQRKSQPQGTKSKLGRRVGDSSETSNASNTTGSRCNPERRTSQAIHEPGAEQRPAGCDSALHGHFWQSEPGVGPLADGIPQRVDRLRALGNAVVPQVAEYVARCVLHHAHV